VRAPGLRYAQPSLPGTGRTRIPGGSLQPSCCRHTCLTHSFCWCRTTMRQRKKWAQQGVGGWASVHIYSKLGVGRALVRRIWINPLTGWVGRL
jgi:hypothetical protein